MFLLDYALKVGQKGFKILNICYIYKRERHLLSFQPELGCLENMVIPQLRLNGLFSTIPKAFEVSLMESLKVEKCLGWVLRKLLDYLWR